MVAKNPLAEYLREMIDRRHGGSTRAAAMYITVENSTLLRILHGTTKQADTVTCRKIARWAGVPDEYILRLAGHMAGPTERDFRLERLAEVGEARRALAELGAIIEQRGPIVIDVWGSASAGYPTSEEAQVVDRIVLPVNAIWVRIVGDSLLGLGIENGDVIVVDPENKQPRRSDLVVVRLLDSDEIVVKRWYPEDDHVRLEPANARYRAIEARNLEIIGVVVYSARWRRH